MVFKTLDVEGDLAAQGYLTHSYDTIIAVNVLHATRDLSTTLRNVRWLLKPGGYLLLNETTGSQSLRATFNFGGLEGWWLAEEEERRFSPLLSPVDWDMRLQDAGFLGADKIIHDIPNEPKQQTSLIVSQAVDAQRDPLSTTAALSPVQEPVLLIGGKTLATSKLIKEVQGLLHRQCRRNVKRVEHLEGLEAKKPTMGHECPELQLSHSQSEHVPRHLARHGRRNAPDSFPSLWLEAGTAPTIAARHLVEAMLRLREDTVLNGGDNIDNGDRHLLWSHEPEIDLLANGQMMIPRVKLDSPLNEAYNASARTITKTVDANRVRVQVVAGPDKMKLQSIADTTWINPASNAARAPVMAPSTENASIVDAEHTAVVNLNHDHLTPAVLLHAAACIDSLIKDKDHPTTPLYGAEKSLADLVSARLAQRGAHAYFASSSGDVSEDWLKIHPLCSKFSASKLIPFGVGAFIDCLGSAESASASNVLQSCLPRSCILRQLDAGLIKQASKDAATLRDDACSYAKTAKIPESSQHTNVVVIPAAELAGAHTHALRNKTYVTDWQTQDFLLVTIPSLETQGLFKADKTYLRLGAAGGLGTSICHWMLYNGAKHVIITSRNPQGDPGMLEAARLCGATVRVVQMDVCSRPSIDHVIDHIRGTMPPIAGVCNAAMVLSDKLFLDTNIDQFNSVLGPKVDGIKHLDSIFANESLDFFVVLGSLASIAKNVGQSNYHWANLLMESLVAQRRSRGLAASIIHIGYVCDAGYVARHSKVNPQNESKREDLRSTDLSETDVHYAFAQAVRGRNPKSTCGSHNIIMGIEPPTHPLDPTKRQAIWLSDPRLGHMVPPSSLQSQREEIEHTSATSSSVKQQVNKAQTENHAVSIVLKAFCNKLESTLLLPPGSIEEDNVQRPVIDLGIDSLVAVEIRTWLLRELGVEIPVVKILGGDTVAQLCASVVKLMARNKNKMAQVREVPQESPTLLLNLEGKATPKMDAAIEASAGVIEAYGMQALDKNATGSYLDWTEMQLLQDVSEALERPLAIWEAEFKTLPEALPPLPMALVLLARLANTEDVCIGIVDANRRDARSAQMVACFVNMLPLRSRVSGKATLEDIARAAFRKALLAFAHGSVPLDKILDRVKAPRSTGATPLSQVAMNYRPNTTMAWDMTLGNECQMELSPYDIKNADSHFISVLISEIVGGGLGIELYCQKALYTLEGSQALPDSYLLVLESFTSAPAQRVDECVVYNPIEVDQAIKLGKGPEMDFGWPATMSERIMDMCHCTTLAANVHDAANAVLAAGCVVDSRIAVLCDPTVDAIVAMLAILHIGAVYVPLDSSLPRGRHSAMISSSKPELIVSQEATHERVQDLRRVVSVEWPGVECRIDKIWVSQERRSNLGEATVSEPRTIEPNSPAILLYTSGSTGIPKGVVLSQANFANHIALNSNILGLGRGQCVLQQSSLGFNMSLVQTICALANGGCLIIVPADAKRDPVELTSLICHHKVSLTIATPSEYLTRLQYGTKSLKQNTARRHVCLGGEPVSQQLKYEIRRLDLKDLTLTNCYGPTEITAAASFKAIHLGEHGEQIKDEWARYAVGKALPYYSLRILGPARLPLPVNHTSEICIGGSGVALEYLGSSEETLNKFILDEGQRFYCTGDKGRLLPDGTLLCFGRLEGDNQVKLRGLRIELEGVETALIHASGGLFHGAVASRRGDVLVAQVTLSPGERANNVGDEEITTILRQLTKVLPQHVVPAAIVILPQLPTNANGKLDRKAIAALPLPQRVLPKEGTSRIGPSSDFFLSGGNSLLLMKLQAAIRESMGISVSTKALYQASTLDKMARHIHERRQIIVKIAWRTRFEVVDRDKGRFASDQARLQGQFQDSVPQSKAHLDDKL
ncbi:nonribosomal peptide synthase [Metarhizium acridum CQMa 102]|uniref:Nonribosomal peptide synthase n=1 Tax=Metarhizium acridum (strain CQMa 102) TaxID=655827 RepID=E9E739_METAQ|nr:nonribosomal peptide synthase [Metarhizium acridum CQMa 102]EFY88214.1 nonribosomal peptide synthase [Metarhizium acridum CQMa 102]